MSASPNRAILLASLLILSMAPISGIASAEITRGSGNAQYNVSDGSGNVTDGGVIFQGEADIQFRNNTTDQVIPATTLLPNDQVSGVTLTVPIPQNQPPGEYNDRSGFSVTVDSPRVTEFDINNNDGQDVSGGTLGADQNATVNIEFNFEDSERIDLTIVSENGADVTNEFTSANTTINASVANNVPEVDNTAGSVTIPINTSRIDAGEYIFTAEGDDDFDFGIASQSIPLRVAGDTPTSVTFSNTSVPTDSLTVTVDSVQLGNKSSPTNDFVVVVHQTDDGTFTGNIGTKIGESLILSAKSKSDIIVNLGPLVSQNDTVAQLTNTQTLVAVLHRANPDGGTNHGAPLIRNGSRVSDRAQVTVEPVTSPFPEGEELPGVGSGAGQAPTDPDDDGKFEDINGDGEATFDDVIALAFVNPTRLNSQQTTALDFDSDGNVDFDDVIELAFE